MDWSARCHVLDSVVELAVGETDDAQRRQAAGNQQRQTTAAKQREESRPRQIDGLVQKLSGERANAEAEAVSDVPAEHELERLRGQFEDWHDHVEEHVCPDHASQAAHQCRSHVGTCEVSGDGEKGDANEAVGDGDDSEAADGEEGIDDECIPVEVFHEIPELRHQIWCD